jgi:tetratricopeptide (TPR) repeat protein
MKKLILSFFVCGVMTLPAFSQTYQELSDRAVAATEQDSLTQAEEYILQALKLEPANPHNALLFSNLGTIQRRQRRYDQALESYTFALNIAPRALPILLNRAALYLELGKDDLARIDYSWVLDIDKDNAAQLTTAQYAELYVARAGVENDMKHVDLAMMDLEEAIRLDASLTDAYLMRGQIYLSQKKKDLAKRDFEKAVALGIPHADVRDLLQQCK